MIAPFEGGPRIRTRGHLPAWEVLPPIWDSDDDDDDDDSDGDDDGDDGDQESGIRMMMKKALNSDYGGESDFSCKRI